MEKVQSSIFAEEIHEKLENGRNFRTVNDTDEIACEKMENITPQKDCNVDEKGNGIVHFTGTGRFLVEGFSQIYSFEGYAIAKDFQIEKIERLPIVIRKR